MKNEQRSSSVSDKSNILFSLKSSSNSEPSITASVGGKTVFDFKLDDNIIASTPLTSLERFENSTTIKKTKNGAEEIFKASDDDVNPLLNLLKTDDVETGIVTNAERHYHKMFITNKLRAIEVIKSIYLSCSHLPRVQIGILHLLSHIPYRDIYPDGQLISLAALLSKNPEVQEYGVKCYENWHDKSSLSILTTINSGHKWLQNYIESVISDIKNS